MEAWRKVVRQLWIGLGILAAVMLLIGFNQRMADLRRLEAEEVRVAAQATELMSTVVYLETQIAAATSDEAVEQWAHEEGRMVRPGEVLVVPLPAGEVTPQPRTTPTEIPTEIPRWKVWYALFFSDLP
jgi:cell division protein FtsB